MATRAISYLYVVLLTENNIMATIALLQHKALATIWPMLPRSVKVALFLRHRATRVLIVK